MAGVLARFRPGEVRGLRLPIIGAVTGGCQWAFFGPLGADKLLNRGLAVAVRRGFVWVSTGAGALSP